MNPRWKASLWSSGRPPSAGAPRLVRRRPEDGRRHEDAGITLVEVMAATVISLVVVGAGFTALIVSNKTARVNDLVAGTQQNVRLAMELLSQDVKLAGFGMSGPVGACTLGGTPVPIVPGDNQPAGPDQGPDAIRVVVPSTNAAVAPVWTLAAQAQGPFNVITLQPGAVAAMDAQAGGGGALTGSSISIGGAVSSTVQAFDAGADTITLATQIGAPKIFPSGTQAYLLECVAYSIGTTAAACDGGAPCLLRAGVPLVEGIEDIQFAYACDGCNAAINGGIPDGIPDDQNASNTFDVGDFITNNAWNLSPMTPDKIRLVEINVVARQTQQDLGVSETTLRQTVTAGPVIVSDHDPSNDAGFDPATYQLERRRLLTRTVQTRNAGTPSP